MNFSGAGLTTNNPPEERPVGVWFGDNLAITPLNPRSVILSPRRTGGLF